MFVAAGKVRSSTPFYSPEYTDARPSPLSNTPERRNSFASAHCRGRVPLEPLGADSAPVGLQRERPYPPRARSQPSCLGGSGSAQSPRRVTTAHQGNPRATHCFLVRAQVATEPLLLLSPRTPPPIDMAVSTVRPGVFVRFKKLKGTSRVLAAARHNLRELPPTPNITAGKQEANQVVWGAVLSNAGLSHNCARSNGNR